MNPSVSSTSHSTYESISSGFSGLPVRDDDSLLDVAELLEEVAETLVCRVVRKATDEDLGESRILLHPGDWESDGDFFEFFWGFLFYCKV